MKKHLILIVMLLGYVLGTNPPIHIARAQTENPQMQETFFNFTIITNTDFGDLRTPSQLIAEEFEKIGIGVDTVFLSSGDKLSQMNFFLDWENGSFVPALPTPLYSTNSTGFDMGILGTCCGSTDGNYYGYGWVPWYTHDNFTRETYQEGGINIGYHNYFNPEWYAFEQEFIHTLDVDKRQELFQQIQEIQYNEIPAFGLQSLEKNYILNTAGNINQTTALAIINQQKPSLFEDLTFSTNDKLMIGLPFHNDRYNPFADDLYTQLVFQPLYENEIGDPNSWYPLLGKQMPTWNANQTIATVEIREDVFFADGHQLDAEDVKKSYDYLIDNVVGDLGIQFANFFNDKSLVRIVDTFTVEFEFLEPNPFAMNMLSYEIVPAHIWEKIFDHTFYPDQIFIDLLVNDTSKFGFGSGPYQFGSIEFDCCNIMQYFHSVDNYWNGDVPTSEIIIADIDERHLKDFINNGTLKLWLGSDGQKAETILSSLDLEQFISGSLPVTNFAFLSINHNHPIFGTGIDTPIGSTSPDKAKLAANYVRKAMNHAIPRNAIVEKIELDSNTDFRPLMMAINPTTIGLDETLTYQYDLELSKSYMELAGYEYPEQPTTTEKSTTQSNGSTIPQNGFLFFDSMWALAVVSLYFIHTVLRNKNYQHELKYLGAEGLNV